jgi:hypothetical protein
MKKTLFAGIISLAMATNVLAFSDVPQSAWYASYVSDLQASGVIDAGDFFRPADSLNRAELVKMVIEATVGIENYEAPPNPTFDDVPESAWFAPYVETAATLGIVSGYTDETDSLTGMFGPGDEVTRAAAAKILVEAFHLEHQPGVTPSFGDVVPDDWFFQYVMTARSNGIVDGYADGHFGPGGAVSRAEIAKMISLSLHPDQMQEEAPAEQPPANEEETGEENQTPEEKTLEETPANQQLAVPNSASIGPMMLASGSDGNYVASYLFHASIEGFIVQTVTVVNDTTGNNLGDDPFGTPLIKDITLRYPDENGYLKTKTEPLGSDGTTRFTNLDLFVPRNSEAFLEIYADLNSLASAGESYSGAKLRLGLMNTGNDSNSFKAIGAVSNTTINWGSGNLSIPSSNESSFLVRRSVPVFSNTEKTGLLINGTNTLYSFDVTASESGSVSLARLVFDLSVTDANASGLSLSKFELMRNDSTLEQELNIYDSGGAGDISVNGAGTIGNGNTSVIISFNTPEIIAAGDTVNYALRARINGSETDDSVHTSLSEDDSNSELTGLTASGQENTGNIYAAGASTVGIFTHFGDFREAKGTARNVIWSDRSSDNHAYPSVANGIVTTDSGSSDWTNGYLLRYSSLEAQVLSK